MVATGPGAYAGAKAWATWTLIEKVPVLGGSSCWLQHANMHRGGSYLRAFQIAKSAVHSLRELRLVATKLSQPHRS